MKNASGAEAQAFKSSTTSLSVSSGSNWDVCSENSLAIDGRGAIPYETLAASGIPKDVADQLNYRNLEPSEVQEILGYPISGCWGVKYTNPDGSDTLVDGKPFARVRRPDGSKPKYLTPTGAGNRPYFSPLLKTAVLNGGKPLMLTEGEKCTDSANHHGFACVGLAGVYSFTDKASRAGLPELKEINVQGREVLITFDSDIHTNNRVQEAAFRLAELVCRRGATSKVVALPCELDGRKNGVDDFLARHGADALQRLIDIAQPAGHLKKSKNPKEPDDFVRTWEPEPKNDHLVAQMLLTVTEGLYAISPHLGTFKQEKRHWSRLPGRYPMRHPIHQWMDMMRFNTRGKNRIDSIAAEVGAYLKEWDWDNPELVSFKNGTYNIRTNAFVSSRDPDDYLTHSFDYPINRQAKCPTFQALINDTFPADEVDILKGMMRSTVIPKDRNSPYCHEKSVVVIGAKGTGTRTLAESLISICDGEHGVGTLDTDQISNPNVRAGLIGKKGAEVIKLITGIGTPLDGRLLLVDGLQMRFRELHQQRHLNRPPINGQMNYQELCGSACVGSEEKIEMDSDSVEELKQRFESGEALFLVDVRNPLEAEVALIPGAELIPLSTIENGEAVEQIRALSSGKRLYVHCKLGGRSAKAVQILSSHEIKSTNVEGGIDARSEFIDESIPRY